MSFWPILFIFLAIAMAVGPIMMMQPSKRQQYLAAIRQKAAQRGIRVRMSDYLQGRDKRTVAVYMKSRKGEDGQSSWLLLRRAYSHDLHFNNDWDWEKKAALGPSVETQLRDFIGDLSNDFVGVEVNDHMVALWWLERDKSITLDHIDTLLGELAAIA